MSFRQNIWFVGNDFLRSKGKKFSDTWKNSTKDVVAEKIFQVGKTAVPEKNFQICKFRESNV